MDIIEKATLATETYYLVSFKKYEHNCSTEHHKFYIFDDAISFLKEMKLQYAIKLQISKITEDKLDVNML